MHSSSIESQSVSISIENLVGSKSIASFPAQLILKLDFSYLEKGAPCKVMFPGESPDDGWREFNGTLTFVGDYLAAVIENEDGTRVRIATSLPIGDDFKESNYVSRGAVTA